MALNGEAYYRAAIELCDLHPGKRFCDMLGEDAVVGGAMRQYFTGKFRELELMGWHTFAGTGLTDDEVGLAVFELCIDSFQHLLVPEGLV